MEIRFWKCIMERRVTVNRELIIVITLLNDDCKNEREKVVD